MDQFTCSTMSAKLSLAVPLCPLNSVFQFYWLPLNILLSQANNNNIGINVNNSSKEVKLFFENSIKLFQNDNHLNVSIFFSQFCF